MTFIETPRLLLRPHQKDDVAFMVKLNSDPQVVRYTGDVAFKNDDEAAEIIAVLEEHFAARQLGRLLVIERQSAQPIGWCGFNWHPKVQGVDLGFRFLRKKWGHGFATEVGAACLRWIHANTDIDHIFARAIPENIGSVRVLEKLGFVADNTLDPEGFAQFQYRP